MSSSNLPPAHQHPVAGRHWKDVNGTTETVTFHGDDMKVTWTKVRDLQPGQMVAEFCDWDRDRDCLVTVREVNPVMGPGFWGNGADVVWSNGTESHCSANAPMAVVEAWAV